MRNLILLGCAVLLAWGLVLTTFTGVVADIPDTDMDGIPDFDDNCIVVPNGPLGSTDSCNAQEDGDLDGYGNPCDSDFNNNGASDLIEVGVALQKAAAVSTDNNFDTNCNGAVDFGDVSFALNRAGLAMVPGPSGLACAGTIPCP